MNTEIIDVLLHRPLPNGGWLDYFVKDAESIGQFIRENKLTPVKKTPMATLVGDIPVEATQMGTGVKAFVRIPDPGLSGGIRVSHLHFEGNVYLLNEKQWADFSSKIIGESKAKLANAHTVNFDQAMNLAKATEALS